jgi:hypothetical protein
MSFLVNLFLGFFVRQIVCGLHAMLAWTGNPGAASTNFDQTALTDADFSVRTGHYIFTEDYMIRYLWAQGVALTDSRLLCPTFAAINTDGLRITGFQQKAGVGGVPTLFDKFDPATLMLPKYEEVQGQGSSSATGQQWTLMNIMTPNGPIPVPQGQVFVIEGTTAAFTPAANVWSGPQILVLNNNPRGGVYAVVRVTCQQAADTLAFRVIFPRHPYYKGRKLRPGWCAQNAVGSFDDVITQLNPYHLGVWGYFHTFELPTVEVLATTSAAMTPVFRLWVVYLGGDLAQLNQLIGAQNVV